MDEEVGYEEEADEEVIGRCSMNFEMGRGDFEDGGASVGEGVMVELELKEVGDDTSVSSEDRTARDGSSGILRLELCRSGFPSSPSTISKSAATPIGSFEDVRLVLTRKTRRLRPARGEMGRVRTCEFRRDCRRNFSV